MKHRPLRIGILGSGFIAGVHARSLQKINDVTLAAVANNHSQSAAASFADKHQIPAYYRSFAAMLNAASLDAVYLCIPPFAHSGEAELAAAKGLHVFLEKPIALDATQAESMVAAIETAGVKSQVGFHMRHLKSVQAAKALIESGEAGQPTLFTGRYWVNMDGSPWWRDVSKSGGQLFEQVTHLYDLATHLCGSVESARGILRNLCRAHSADYSIEDTSVGTLQFCNGAIGVITGSNCALPNHFLGDFRLVCQNLTLDYRCTGQNWVTPDQATLHRPEHPVETVTEDGDPYRRESEDFIAAIRDDRPTTAPARTGLEAIRLVESVLADAKR